MKVLMLGNEPNKCLLFKILGWEVVMVISGVADGVKQRIINETSNYKTVKSYINLDHYISIFKRSREIKKLTKEFKSELIFVNTKKDMLAVKLAFIFKKHKPIRIGAFCNSYSWNNNRKVKLLLPFLKRCFDGYISMARFAYDKLEQYGFPSNKHCYLQNYVDYRNFFKKDNYSLSGKDVRILFVGIISKGKNQRFFIELALRLKQEGYNPIITLCGDFVDEKESEYIKQQIVEHDLQSNILLLGRVENSLVRKMIPENDFYVSPTVSEMCPNNILEAKASAATIVCSNVCGQQDLIENDITGCLFKYDDVEECLSIILKLIKDENLRKKLGKNAYLDASEKNSYLVGAQTLKHFIESISSKREKTSK